MYRIGHELAKRGHHVTYNQMDLTDVQVLVVQKRFDLHDYMMDAKNKGIRVVWDCDDFLKDGPIDACNIITTDTKKKRALYPTAHIISDSLDVDPDSFTKSTHHIELKNVVGICNPENVYHYETVAKVCLELGLKLRIITNLEKATLPVGVLGIPWDLTTVDSEMVRGDVCVLPFIFNGQWPREWIEGKSSNRLLKAWGLGVPVIGAPLLSYVEEGLKYVAETHDDWVRELTRMQDAKLRASEGMLGYSRARLYRADRLLPAWLSILT